MPESATKKFGRAVLIGAGPAGLTSAWELLTRTSIKPIVLEADNVVGGISRTAVHRGNRIDIGGHRFFSKSSRVMEWWQAQMPVAAGEGEASGPADEPVMLVRSRLSRILYQKKFFKYPLSLEWETLSKMGLFETFLAGVSFVWSSLFPHRPEKTLEDFFINRFGKRLYETFFKDYTEKVWGVACQDIPSDWGAQRVKGLSIFTLLHHAVTKAFVRSKSLDQKKVETSLIERFLYPKCGPGQLWETVAGRIIAKGGNIAMNRKVIALRHENNRIFSVQTQDAKTGQFIEESADLFVSTMPIRDLFLALDPPPPKPILTLALQLQYRDFITVGLLLKKVTIHGVSADGTNLGQVLPDNWIYVQEPYVKVGRIQVFNNWSPYMVEDPRHVWLGLEYFANVGDKLWSLSEEELIALGKEEMEKIGFSLPVDCLDAVVIRMPKAYPSYFGEGYARFDELRAYLDNFTNLRLLGRNGMHRYNNQDHSMLTAMTMVDNLVADRDDTSNLWAVNVEKEYHEEKKEKTS